MKKFRFTMEEVLNLRVRAEEQALEQLARALGRQQQALHARTLHEQEIARLAAAPTPPNPQQMMLRQAQVELMEAQRAAKHTAVQEAEFAVRHAREQVGRAQAERKVIEKLRERREEEWQQEMLRAEERQLGEIAQTQLHRRRAAAAARELEGAL